MELSFQEYNFDDRLVRYKSEYSLLTTRRYCGADNTIFKDVADKLRDKGKYLKNENES